MVFTIMADNRIPYYSVFGNLQSVVINIKFRNRGKKTNCLNEINVTLFYQFKSH